jgi:hypothetical protein
MKSIFEVHRQNLRRRTALCQKIEESLLTNGDDFKEEDRGLLGTVAAVATADLIRLAALSDPYGFEHFCACAQAELLAIHPEREPSHDGIDLLTIEQVRLRAQAAKEAHA